MHAHRNTTQTTNKTRSRIFDCHHKNRRRIDSWEEMEVEKTCEMR